MARRLALALAALLAAAAPAGACASRDAHPPAATPAERAGAVPDTPVAAGSPGAPHTPVAASSPGAAHTPAGGSVPATPETPHAPGSGAATPRPRALWVLAEGSQRVLERRGRLDLLLDDARALGATDLFVQVYRGGRAWFDSSLADAAPWHATWRERDASGAERDALATLIERAHAAGLRVHAWVNVLSLASNPNAPIVRDLGPDAVLVDQWGRSLLDYPGFDVPPPDSKHVRLGTPGVFLDPAAPGVAERIAATFEELVRRYPGLDGLHLDYVRYPDTLPFAPGTRFGVGLSFGYGAATRARFRAETGLEAPFAGTVANAARFDAWRREQLTALVARIRERALAARPGLVLSAAVFHDDERAYLTVFQDWRGWLEAGLLDVAVPMLYSTDDRLLRYRVVELAGLPEATRIWVGLGTWLFGGDPARAVAQARLVERTGALGVSLFSWDALREKDALREALAAASADAGAVSATGRPPSAPTGAVGAPSDAAAAPPHAVDVPSAPAIPPAATATPPSAAASSPAR